MFTGLRRDLVSIFPYTESTKIWVGFLPDFSIFYTGEILRYSGLSVKNFQISSLFAIWIYSRRMGLLYLSKI